MPPALPLLDRQPHPVATAPARTPPAAALHRPDIDGLRALAIVPVVLFHAHVAGFGGGFVGVDVFFVISGFLITGILARELEQGRFSLLRFYERRARRILPSLLFSMSWPMAQCLRRKHNHSPAAVRSIFGLARRHRR